MRELIKNARICFLLDRKSLKTQHKNLYRGTKTRIVQGKWRRLADAKNPTKHLHYYFCIYVRPLPTPFFSRGWNRRPRGIVPTGLDVYVPLAEFDKPEHSGIVDTPASSVSNKHSVALNHWCFVDRQIEYCMVPRTLRYWKMQRRALFLPGQQKVNFELACLFFIYLYILKNRNMLMNKNCQVLLQLKRVVLLHFDY